MVHPIQKIILAFFFSSKFKELYRLPSKQIINIQITITFKKTKGQQLGLLLLNKCHWNITFYNLSSLYFYFYRNDINDYIIIGVSWGWCFITIYVEQNFCLQLISSTSPYSLLRNSLVLLSSSMRFLASSSLSRVAISSNTLAVNSSIRSKVF